MKVAAVNSVKLKKNAEEKVEVGNLRKESDSTLWMLAVVKLEEETPV